MKEELLFPGESRRGRLTSVREAVSEASDFLFVGNNEAGRSQKLSWLKRQQQFPPWRSHFFSSAPGCVFTFTTALSKTVALALKLLVEATSAAMRERSCCWKSSLFSNASNIVDCCSSIRATVSLSCSTSFLSLSTSEEPGSSLEG